MIPHISLRRTAVSVAVGLTLAYPLIAGYADIRAACGQRLPPVNVGSMSALALLLGLATIAVLLALARERSQRRELLQRLAQEAEQARRLERAEAAASERRRVFRDIHDDIGAKLLTLLHEMDRPELADHVRSVMLDLRDVVSRSGAVSGTLQQVLGQIREEAEPRLDAVGATLEWQVAADVPDLPLDEAQALHLHRITREAISNAIRHAHVRHLRMRCRRQGDVLVLDYTDDGPGRSKQGHESTGTHSMRERAEALGGRLSWTEGTGGGTKIILEFPLPAAPRSPNEG